MDEIYWDKWDENCWPLERFAETFDLDLEELAEVIGSHRHDYKVVDGVRYYRLSRLNSARNRIVFRE